ncbi:bifunctional alpha/beta hydrolase/OsmC family protein [Hyphomonas johnsonii]|uniref:OsmC family protein n=1 Tax=Hyphomonas johnsonii MHS-2 TaxID=1280950 RepID=A0A059FSW0_9PROT|nr:bifunctional alpha/beta hydrolase/OsmC family protein [Hyphomonas johnsonii]KCZ93785.1 OsmC family protein [Hyphomonas johnsonii MHS-2]
MTNQARVEFPGHDGALLAARLDAPVFAPKAWALFAHCFSCSKDGLAARRITAALVEAGIGVMRFDFTGLGNSEGDFSNTNFSTNIQDLVAAAAWLEREKGGPHLLVGHSLGGAAVIVAAADIPQAKAVVTVGAPSEASHVIESIKAHVDTIEAEGEAEVQLAGRPFVLKRQFLDDVRASNVRDAAATLKRPLLIMHSPVDESVGIDNATGLFVAARHPKSFISLDKANHLLTTNGDARRAGRMMAAWAEAYVFAAGVAQPDHATGGTRDVVVTETGNGLYENMIVTGEHFSLADEPIAVGGGGRGPDPYEYVSAGLGACTSMTVRMYANRKKWPLERVSVAVHHAKDYAVDCEHCEEGEKISIFYRDITLTGALDAAQVARLMEIADKCPVHRTLEAGSHVQTQGQAVDTREST